MRSAFLALVLVLATSAVAHAQTMSITVTGLDDRESTRLNLMTAPVNEDECMNASITLLLNNIMVTGTMQQLDVWRGNAGTNCSDQAARNMMTRTCTPLTLSTTVQLTSVDVMKTLNPIPLSELLDCSVGGNYDLYFLIANGPTTLEPITNYGVLTIYYDKTRPMAPTGITGGSGDSSVNVSWTTTGESNLRETRVYGDPSGGGCGSGFFTVGEPVPDGAVELGTGAGSAADATVDLSALGLAVGESADVVVVTVDQALNESLVGSIGCVERVATTGFCDAYGDCQSCSVSEVGLGGRRSGARSRSVGATFAFAVVGLAGLAAALRRRGR